MESRSFNLFEQQDLVRKIAEDDNNPSFFILNNSERPDHSGKPTRDPGMVIFNVIENGQSRAIRIPVSWVPVDAATQATKKAIVGSAEFNRALSAGAIMILTQDEGKRIITADSESQDEYSRVMAIAQGVNGPTDSGFGGVNGSDRGPVEDPWANVSQEVRLNVEDVIEGVMTAAQFKSFMRRADRSISALDRSYIAEKIPTLNNPVSAQPTTALGGDVSIQT